MSFDEITAEVAIDAVDGVLGSRRGAGTELSAETRLVDLGLDSLDLAELFISLEKAAGERLDPASAGALERIGDLTRLRPLQ